MAGLYDEAFLEALRQGAAGVAPLWGLSPRTEVSLLTISENATFLARDPERERPVVIRVHRPGYHTLPEIESELSWIAALRADGVVSTPEPLGRIDGGGRIAAFDHGGDLRHVAAFSFLDGAEPSPDESLVAGFERLGALSARLHEHVRGWRAPDGFVRKVWDYDTTVGPTPHWGPWRDALGLTAEGARLLERCAEELRGRLAAYGAGPDRFGLIHADLRLANLLVDGDRLSVIDFDDSGYGWFVYDFAAAISFLEHETFVDDLADAWTRGYRAVAPLSAEDAAMIPTMVMLRRLLLTAWIASHAETPTAADAGHAAYTEGTLMLAERFLARP
jgi:Ser/Thr protein kinase RdoA (MazF antagonist)